MKDCVVTFYGWVFHLRSLRTPRDHPWHKCSSFLSQIWMSHSFSHTLCCWLQCFVFVYLWVWKPALWWTVHLPVCSGSMLIRCCSCPGCEGHGSGSSRSCVPERRPPQSGPERCASKARLGGTSTGSGLQHVTIILSVYFILEITVPTLETNWFTAMLDNNYNDSLIIKGSIKGVPKWLTPICISKPSTVFV